MTFVDSHAHLDASDFHLDLEETLERADQAGVGAILSIGCVQKNGSELTRFLQLLNEHEHVYGGVGVHPHDARCYDQGLGNEIRQIARHPKIVGWGEIGLDFHYDNSPRDRQIECFESQLRLARLSDMPVIVHTREAEALTCEILERECSDPNSRGGVLHCFTGGLKTAMRCLEHGFYISFGGILTFRKSEDLRNTAAQIPLDRLLIETDSPYLAPVPFRGKRNEPAFVVKVAEVLGQLHGKATAEVAAITKTNFDRLFLAHQPLP